MRIWSLHPKHLDRQGLLAVWRESLLAQAVLRGRTQGYKNHPQLERFRSCPSPLQAINHYLWHVRQETIARGYQFDARKVRKPKQLPRIPVQEGQIQYEQRHLLAKLKQRAPAKHRGMKNTTLTLHPLFKAVPGGVEPWERSA